MALAGVRDGRSGTRAGWGELPYRAMVIGVALTIAVVLATILTALTGVFRDGVEPSHGVSALVGPLLAQHDSDDSDSGDSSSGGDSDSGDSGGHHGKKSGGDSDESGGDSGGGSAGESSGGSSGGNSGPGGDGASAGAGPTGMASPGAGGVGASLPSAPNLPGAPNLPVPSGTGIGPNSGPAAGRPAGLPGSGSGQVPVGGATSADGAAALPVPTDSGGMTTTKVVCTKSVNSQAELLRALQSASQSEVICFQPTQPQGLPLLQPQSQPEARPGQAPIQPQSSQPQPPLQGQSRGSASNDPRQRSATPSREPGSATASVGPGGQGSNGVGSSPAVMTESQGGPPGAAVAAQTGCTKRAADAVSLTQALGSAAPGERICVTATIAGMRLKITKGGSAQAPITVIGNGKTAVKGISVNGSNVVVAGFQVLGAVAPGIEIHGNNVTVMNNTVTHPTGGDYDGIRFFGADLRILHNTIMNINPDGSGAHADCMQTFATGSDSSASQHVLIDGNKCQKIDNQCLIAEGPNSSAGDGSGQGMSADITFSNNICEVGASQATEIDDVQGVKVLHNLITGKPDKAFSFQNKSTGAVVQANKIASGIGYEVGMDTTSKVGYQGPKVGGGP